MSEYVCNYVCYLINQCHSDIVGIDAKCHFPTRFPNAIKRKLTSKNTIPSSRISTFAYCLVTKDINSG